MNTLFKPYTENFKLTDNLRNDIATFFTLNNNPGTLEHTFAVAAEAERLAKLYKVDLAKAVEAALLHDISNVIPVSQMLDISDQLGIEVLEEERSYNRSVHQKLSKLMAEEIFAVSDSEILSAIESHTTHKPNASMVDKILFVSDKISWNLPGEHPYLRDMREKVDGLELDAAIFIYLEHIWGQRNKLKLVHPWLIAAREELLHKI
ncbi:bis(5'-nucleosyl)-tetraphosphatase (symmetrical) YqeK [Neobacillus mesonae]|nr:bis(5'-nucleosyl)-tetraphosphatase (symmetrical) YqeK [Neobacillus mesonae]